MAEERIPNYALYGETQRRSDLIAFHIEEIAERSRDRDWIINAHRHGSLFQVLCIFDGEVDVRLDAGDHHLEGTWAVVIPPGAVHSFQFRPNSEGVVITLAEAAVDNAGVLHPLFDRAEPVSFNADDEYKHQLRHYIDLMREEFAAVNSAKQTALFCLAKLFLITINRQREINAREATPDQSNLKTLNAFRKLLESHYKDHWQVTDYARQLNVSTSTLNRVCRERFDASAKSLILARLMAEAERRLIFTRQPLEEIAYYLGYKDPAYFSRVFKKHAQLAPGEFRKTHCHNA